MNVANPVIMENIVNLEKLVYKEAPLTIGFPIKMGFPILSGLATFISSKLSKCRPHARLRHKDLKPAVQGKIAPPLKDKFESRLRNKDA